MYLIPSLRLLTLKYELLFWGQYRIIEMMFIYRKDKKVKCIICEHLTHAITHKVFGTYFHCDHCEVIFKDPSAHIALEEAFEIYESHENSIEDERYVAYFKKYLEASVLPYLKHSDDVLDFGSGPSPVLAQILERDYGLSVDLYDQFYAPEKIYEGKHYDLITTTEVVEHLDDPIAYFKLFKRLLKKNGLLAVMTQFHKNDEAFFMNWHYMRDRSHIVFFRDRTFRVIAEKVGLKILYTNGKNYITFMKDHN